MILKYHKTLTVEKWAQFPLNKQLLMIANELNRAKNWIIKNDSEEVRNCYERAFELIDLTLSVPTSRNLLRELLRFRELLAESYLKKRNDAETNRKLFEVLLMLNKDNYNLLTGGVK
ncbi:MAG: hypothetical protein AB1349_13895 [Elusimicrobiota bacterium]